MGAEILVFSLASWPGRAEVLRAVLQTGPRQGLAVWAAVQQLRLEMILLPWPPGWFGLAFALPLVGLSLITVLCSRPDGC